MCSPTLALAVAGIAISGAGQLQQTRAARQQANFQSAVARNNAIIARRAADDARERGKVEAAKQAARTRQFIGRQKVAQAALGQEVGTGSALDLRADAAAAGKLEERVIQNNAEREAIGFLTQAGSFQAEASLARARASSASRAGAIGFLGTIVSGAGTVSSKFRKFGSVPTAASLADSGPLVSVASRRRVPTSFGPQFGLDVRSSGSF